MEMGFLSKILIRVRILLGKIVRLLGIKRDPFYYLRYSRGIVHVGAHKGEEAGLYDSFSIPVLWVEADDEIYLELCNNISRYKNQQAVSALLGSEEGKEVDFYVGNASVLSSLYTIDKLSDILEIKTTYKTTAKKMRMQTLDNLLKNYTTTYDTLILDVQGAELEVLRGAKSTLTKIKYIIAEASDYQAYRGGCIFSELRSFLAKMGFKIKTKRKVRWKPGVGGEYDVLFVRQ